MSDDLQARLEQALRDFHRYEGLCPDEGQPLERDRECSACQALVMMTDVLREVLALRRAVDRMREAVRDPTRSFGYGGIETGMDFHGEEYTELMDACAEADAARET